MRVSLQKSKNRQFVYIVKDFYSNGKRTTKIMEKLGTVADLMEEKNYSYDEENDLIKVENMINRVIRDKKILGEQNEA